ncbi:MAG: hypothetical protein A2114_02025 [Candidatus Vogelbacteria bacterium GWA1_51_14]|uniref:Reverse transcriptase domain-containing protein n=1 Tax=Candidatus Vogelbacteria bacterium GWA1_51_14 TaxID=1802435 RepID=A0A1G2Q8J5_9BACT|nr:MAG: hypothetical protein A2114_02025 [Candidatus Vogelbacteria bacterium GWA1_51_14]
MSLKASGGGFKGHDLNFEEIISLPNLFRAWVDFKKDKLKKQDVIDFSIEIESNLFNLHANLSDNQYRHGLYHPFYICDPKKRHIHKPTVKDRIVHQAVFRILESIYEKVFIFDSYSSRKGKGIHKAHRRLRYFAWKLSRNNTRPVFFLKCDIKKFFDSVDHDILLSILEKKIKDQQTISLLRVIINSFCTKENKGIPLGNLTSQLFSNIYLDLLDQYVKRVLRVKYYLRYADDFILIDADREKLENFLVLIKLFLDEKLKLVLHKDKIMISKFSDGVDFLGYVIFPYHQVLRTKTKRRAFKNVNKVNLPSYLGLLKHCRGRAIEKKLRELF